MTYPIQFLKSIMILITVCLPIGLGVNLSYFISAAIKRKKLCIDYLGMIISYIIIFTIALISDMVSISNIKLNFNLLGFLLAIPAGLLCIGIEYVAGVGLNYLSTKRWVFQVSVHSVYSNSQKLDCWDISAVALFVILEELIFRCSLFSILLEFNISLLLICATAVAVFALNHVHWGIFIFIQKLLSGCVFVMLYVLFDYNIIIPIIAHLIQNFTLLLLSRRAKE